MQFIGGGLSFTLCNFAAIELDKFPDSTGCRLFDLTPIRNVLIGDVRIFPVDQKVNWRIIQLVIKDSSAVIFDRVLDGGDDKDDDQRHSPKPGIRSTKNGEDLKHNY